MINLPLIKKISPTTVQAGQCNIELVLEGERTDQITDMLFVGEGITVLGFEVLDSGKSRVRLAVDRFARAGYRYLMVVDPQGGIGVARQQLWVEPCPEIPQVQPSRLLRGSRGVRLRLTGASFSQGEEAAVSGDGVAVLKTEWMGPDTVVALVDVEKDAPLGRRDICVAGERVSGRACGALDVAEDDPWEKPDNLELKSKGLLANPWDWS